MNRAGRGGEVDEAQLEERAFRLRHALVVGLAVLGAVHLLLATWAATRLHLGMDLRALWVNGALWNQGVVPYLRAPDPGEPGPVSYPPLAIALFGLMARLPFAELRALWWACQWAMLLASAALLCRLAGRARISELLWILLALSTPLFVQFERGQMELVVLLLLTAAAYLHQVRGADVTPGLLIALAASVKLYPALLAGYMLLRARRMLAAFLASLLLLGAATALVTGPALFAAFADTLPIVGREIDRQHVPGGFAEIVDRDPLMAKAGFPTSSHALVVRADGVPYLYGTWAMAESQTAARWLWLALDATGLDGLAPHALALVALVVLAAASFATVRGTGASPAEALALWTMAALLLVPRAWPFTYVVSLLPAVVLAGALVRSDAARVASRTTLLVAALVAIHAPPPPVAGLLGWRSWPGCLAGGVVLFALLVDHVARTRATPTVV